MKRFNNDYARACHFSGTPRMLALEFTRGEVHHEILDSPLIHFTSFANDWLQYKVAAASGHKDCTGDGKIVLSANGTLYRSLTSGATWGTIAGANTYCRNVAVSKDSAGTYILVTGVGSMSSPYSNPVLQVSRDAGKTWRIWESANNSQNDRFWDACCMSDDGQHMYIAGYTGSLKGPKMSHDGGQSWGQVGGNAVYATDIACSYDGSVVVLGHTQGMRISYDYGSTWTDIAVATNATNSEKGAYGVAVSKTGQHITWSQYGNGKTLMVSHDFGATVATKLVNLVSGLITNITMSETGQFQAATVGNNGVASGVIVSEDFGANWRWGISTGTSMGMTDVVMTHDALHIYAGASPSNGVLASHTTP